MILCLWFVEIKYKLYRFYKFLYISYSLNYFKDYRLLLLYFIFLYKINILYTYVYIKYFKSFEWINRFFRVYREIPIFFIGSFNSSVKRTKFYVKLLFIPVSNDEFGFCLIRMIPALISKMFFVICTFDLKLQIVTWRLFSEWYVKFHSYIAI